MRMCRINIFKNHYLLIFKYLSLQTLFFLMNNRVCWYSELQFRHDGILLSSLFLHDGLPWNFVGIALRNETFIIIFFVPNDRSHHLEPAAGACLIQQICPTRKPWGKSGDGQNAQSHRSVPFHWSPLYPAFIASRFEHRISGPPVVAGALPFRVFHPAQPRK